MAYDDDLLATAPEAAWVGTTDITGNGHDLEDWHVEAGWGVAPVGYPSELWFPGVLGGGDYAGDGPVLLRAPSLVVDGDDPWSFLLWGRAEEGNVGGSDPEGGFSFNLRLGSSGAEAYATRYPWMDDASTYFTVGTWKGSTSENAPFDPWADWVPFVATYDGTTIRAYVDGVEVGSAATLGPDDTPSGPIHLELLGLFARSAFWDRALTPTEVAALSLAPAPPPEPIEAEPVVWDTFGRADAPSLGTAEVGFPWLDSIADSGTWEVDAGAARATSLGVFGSAVAVLRDTTPGSPNGHSAFATVTLPASGWEDVMVGLNPTSWGSAVGAVVTESGNLHLVTYGGAFGGTTYITTASVDVSAGPHTLRVAWDPSPDETRLTAFWDDSEPSWTSGVLAGGWSDVDVPGVLIGSSGLTATFDDVGVLVPPLVMPFVDAPSVEGLGVRQWPYEPDVIFAPFVDAPSLAGTGLGIDLVNSPAVSVPLNMPFTPAPVLNGGIHSLWSDTPEEDIPPRPTPQNPDVPDWPPGYQYGPPTSELSVDGYRIRTAASARPALNAPGEGSFTCLPPGPSTGDRITFRSGGAAVFTGIAAPVETVVADPREEAGQLVTVSAPGALGVDWSKTIVYPDFGAHEPIRTGQPPQDDRIFGFPMNGLVVPGLNWTTSVGGDNGRFGTEREILPLPENWPDNTSRYMWVTDPDVRSQPEGWCYFRKAVGTFPGSYSLFVTALDYARVYIDGVLVATVESSGQSQRVELDFDWDYHLCAVEAYATGEGPAAVMLSMLQRHPTAFGGTDLYSDSGWKALAYPEVSMRSTVGKVLIRLVEEAAARGAPAGQWSCGFSEEADSAGRPWPTGDETPLITLRVGATYLDVLNQLSEALIDWHASPAGSTLLAYRKDEPPGGVGNPWPVAVSAESFVSRTGVF